MIHYTFNYIPTIVDGAGFKSILSEYKNIAINDVKNSGVDEPIAINVAPWISCDNDNLLPIKYSSHKTNMIILKIIYIPKSNMEHSPQI